ncbi:MAG: hypothetical protein IJ379_02970 [Lachnospiraceae bacterium]|nr:hypothetical protein [Lachnospiraceae bacterium]
MKKGCFKGLLFREFYIARKNYGYNLFAYIAMVAVGLLALLSYKYGNLHRYNHLMDAELISTVNLMIKYAPAYTAAFFFGGASDATPNDEKTVWRRFRTASAVTPFRFALAKYTCLLLTLLASFGMTFGWLGLHSLLTGTPFTTTDFGITMALYTVSVLLIIYMQNICILMGTLERAFIILMVSVCAITIPITLKYPDLMTPDGLNQMKELCTTLIPFTPIIILAVFLLGLVCSTMLYGRREK